MMTQTILATTSTLSVVMQHSRALVDDFHSTYLVPQHGVTLESRHHCRGVDEIVLTGYCACDRFVIQSTSTKGDPVSLQSEGVS